MVCQNISSAVTTALQFKVTFEPRCINDVVNEKRGRRRCCHKMAAPALRIRLNHREEKIKQKQSSKYLPTSARRVTQGESEFRTECDVLWQRRVFSSCGCGLKFCHTKRVCTKNSLSSQLSAGTDTHWPRHTQQPHSHPGQDFGGKTRQSVLEFSARYRQSCRVFNGPRIYNPSQDLLNFEIFTTFKITEL